MRLPASSLPVAPLQCRAARALLAWSQTELAEASGIPAQAIARFELQGAAPRDGTLAALRATLEAAGVDFIAEKGGRPGVRMRRAQAG